MRERLKKKQIMPNDKRDNVKKLIKQSRCTTIKNKYNRR